MSANTAGISVYILGTKDKTYLAKTYGKKLGRASVTGYCIKFKALKDINIDVLETAIREHAGNFNRRVQSQSAGGKRSDTTEYQSRTCLILEGC
jgi:hypothetical protein